MDYEMLERVGKGYYGEVWRAKHKRTGAVVAVKIVGLLAGEEDAPAIQQEVQMLSALNHENIVRYIGSTQLPSELRIVMEYCGGGSVHDLVRDVGPFTEPQIAFVMRETLKALQYLHTQGILHRDVKGANILLTLYGDVKLVDFGIAARITETLSRHQTVTGTAYWMAPEVVNPIAGYRTPCDIWSLGITAIELSEPQHPHFRLSLYQVVNQIGNPDNDPPRLMAQKWSREFVAFVGMCLVKNPDQRARTDQLLASNQFIGTALTLSTAVTLQLIANRNVGQQGPSGTAANQQPQHQQPQQQQPPEQEEGSRQTGFRGVPGRGTGYPFRGGPRGGRGRGGARGNH